MKIGDKTRNMLKRNTVATSLKIILETLNSIESYYYTNMKYGKITAGAYPDIIDKLFFSLS